MTTTIRFATLDDFVKFDEPPGPTVRAVAVEVDGEVLAIGGIAYLPGRNLAFMQSKPGIPATTLFKATRKALQEILSQTKPPIIAERDESIESSGRYLERFGFEHMQGNLYIWKGNN